MAWSRRWQKSHLSPSPRVPTALGCITMPAAANCTGNPLLPPAVIMVSTSVVAEKVLNSDSLCLADGGGGGGGGDRGVVPLPL